jgi:hypothetical protein
MEVSVSATNALPWFVRRRRRMGSVERWNLGNCVRTSRGLHCLTVPIRRRRQAVASAIRFVVDDECGAWDEDGQCRCTARHLGRMGTAVLCLSEAVPICLRRRAVYRQPMHCAGCLRRMRFPHSVFSSTTTRRLSSLPSSRLPGSSPWQLIVDDSPSLPSAIVSSLPLSWLPGSSPWQLIHPPPLVPLRLGRMTGSAAS